MAYKYIGTVYVNVQTIEKHFYATDQDGKIILFRTKFIFRRQGDLIRALAKTAMYSSRNGSQNYTLAKKQIESLILTNQILIKQL